MKHFIFATFIVFFHAVSSLKTVIPCSGDNVDCNYFTEGSTCVEDVCSCGSEAVESADGTRCLPLAGYGIPCTESVQCSEALGPGGLCDATAASCVCSPNYHYLQGKCWRSVPLQGSCFQDQQCFSAFDFTGLHCLNGVCECRPEYYQRAGACRRLAAGGEACIFNSDCRCDGGVAGQCSVRVCKCPAKTTPTDTTQHITLPSHFIGKDAPCQPGFYETDGNCIAEIGTACDGAVACTTGAVCLDNRACGCDTLRLRAANNRKCDKLTIAFNGTCTSNEACVAFGVDSVCGDVNGKKVCSCRDGSHYTEAEQYCQVNVAIGDKCEADSDCFTISGSSVECKQNKCSCVAGTHAISSNLDCLPDGLQVGAKCYIDSDCMFPNGKCDVASSVCVCDAHYYASEDGQCLSGVGSKCDLDDNCKIPHTECASNACLCVDGFISSDDYSACFPFKEHGESCQQDSECNPSMGDLKACKNGICTCQDDSQYIFMRCYAKKKLGEKCKARAECIYAGDEDTADAYICQNGICKCQYGYHQEDNTCI